MRKYLCHSIIACMLFSSSVLAEHYGPTLANEPLYAVALKVRPNHSVSVQQVMVAIVNANPSAFNAHNVNGLKSGYRLKIPSLATIQKIGPETAARKVEKQNNSWTQSPKGKAKKSPHSKKAKHSSQQQNQHEEQANNKPVDTFQPVQQQPVSQNVQPAVVPQFIEETKREQEQTKNQIATLQQQVNNLEGKVNQLHEELRVVTYNFIQAASQISNKKSTDYASLVINNFKLYGSKLGLSLFVFLVLYYLFRRSYRSKPVVNQNHQHSEPAQDEYDFMSSDESIPSKLDLARVYIDMGDYSAAQTALREVIEKGNTEQKKGAEDLLGKLNFAL